MLARSLRALRLARCVPSHGLRAFATNDFNPNRALGFSFPAPRVLDEIANVDKLRAEDTDTISHIWYAHHKDSESALATVIRAADYRLLMTRSKQSPLFLFPIAREGGFFNLISQFQDRYCLLTYLEDYKKNAAMAQPYMTVTLYDDLLDDKGLALVRADFGLSVTRQEAMQVLANLQVYYLQDSKYAWVDTFNNTPSLFDFEAFIKAYAPATPPSGA